MLGAMMLSAAALAITAPLPAAQPGGSGSAQGAVGSAQRRAILDALRPAVEARLGPHVEFVVQALRVEKGWAFVMAEPRRRGGRPIDARTVFPEDWENMDGLTTTAVLRLQNGRWNLIEHAIGATDVWYCDIGPQSLKRGYGC